MGTESDHEVLSDITKKSQNNTQTVPSNKEADSKMARTLGGVKAGKVTVRAGKKPASKNKGITSPRQTGKGRGKSSSAQDKASTKKVGAKASTKKKAQKPIEPQASTSDAITDPFDTVGDDEVMPVRSGFNSGQNKRKANEQGNTDLDTDEEDLLELTVSQDELADLDSEQEQVDPITQPDCDMDGFIEDELLVKEAQQLRFQVQNKKRSLLILEKLEKHRSKKRKTEIEELRQQLEDYDSRIAQLRQRQATIKAKENTIAAAPKASFETPQPPPSPQSCTSQRSWLPPQERQIVEKADAILAKRIKPNTIQALEATPLHLRDEIDRNPPKRQKVFIEEASSSDEPLGKSSTSSSDSESDSQNRHKKRNKKSKLKSGRFAKYTTRVIKPQRWPHNHLDPQFIHNIPKFNDLSWDQMVAGELAVILTTKSEKQKLGRIKLLRQLAYWKIRSNDVLRVRKLYTAVVSAIEQGEYKWDSDFKLMEVMVMGEVAVRGQTNNTQKSREQKSIFFCRKYQQGECTQPLKNNGHTGQLGSRTVTMLHICATCWLKDKKQEKHSEKSGECPHKKE